MNDQNKELSAKISARSGKMTPLAFEQNVKSWLVADGKRNLKKLNALMGGSDQGQRLMICALQSLEKNPMLLECTPDSFFMAVMQCAELNLFPGPLQEAAIVPFREHGFMKAQFMPMYYGLVKLLYNSSMIKSITPGIVRDGDFFEYEKGSNSKLIHKPLLESADGRGIIGYYCHIQLLNDGEIFEFMTEPDVMKFKARSRASGSKFSPWNSEHQSDRDAMALKTVFKQLQKYLPRSPQLVRAFELDNQIDEPKEVDSKTVLVGSMVDTIKQEFEIPQNGEGGVS